MGTLNIYKIDNDKLQDLMQTLNQKNAADGYTNDTGANRRDKRKSTDKM